MSVPIEFVLHGTYFMIADSLIKSEKHVKQAMGKAASVFPSSFYAFIVS